MPAQKLMNDFSALTGKQEVLWSVPADLLLSVEV